jgi:RNA polymerase sigma factor (sigma-70 family)
MKTDQLPSEPDHQFLEILARVRQGDETAAEELVQRYERAVLRAVRARLGKPMRSVLDSVDIAQSVHRSLLVGLRQKRFDFDSPRQLVALAVVMVQRKVARQWRRIGKLPMGQLDGRSQDDTPNERIASRDPTVSRIAAADELLNMFLSQLDGFDQQLVRLRLSGHSSVESARLLNREPAFVRMRWSRLRKKLQDNGFYDL